MAANELIKELKKQMKRGDKPKIATATKLSIATINRFFNGEDSIVSFEAATAIIDEATKLIAEHKKQVKLNEKKIKKLIEG